MPTQPFNLGNALMQAENILALRDRRDPNSLQNQLLMRKLQGGIDPTADIQNYEYFSQLTPEQQRMFLQAKRAQQIRQIGGFDQIVNPDQTLTPLSDLETEADAAARLRGAGAYSAERGKMAAQAGMADPTAPVDPSELNLGVQSAASIPSAAELAGKRVTAEEEARAGVKQKTIQRENDKTWRTYDVAMRNVMIAMDKAFTAPGMGILPPATAAQQIAEGSLATIRPLLKAAFRSAGEGTFTDRDQALLDAMLPTRNDLPETRRVKIGMINQIMAAKLGQSDAVPDWYEEMLRSAPDQVDSDWFDHFLGDRQTGGANDSETYEQRKARILGQ